MDDNEIEDINIVNNESFLKPLISGEIVESSKSQIRFKYLLFVFYLIFFYIFDTKIPTSEKYPSRYHSIRKMRTYIDKCYNGDFLNNNNEKYSSNTVPLITTVIPVYNSHKTIKAAVRSVQNQDMKDMEIILVNDFSKDNSSLILEQLAKEDKRIKIINNKKNMGTLYSRNAGILQAKGKYIMNLDNDDYFIDNDVYDVVYKEIEKIKFDIVGFVAVSGVDYKGVSPTIYEDYFHNHQAELILYQPNLTFFPYVRNGMYCPNDYHVWGRLVRTDLYQKSINNLGKTVLGDERGLQFLSWAEDTLMSVVLFSFAKSYKFIRKYGIFHWMSQTTASNTRPPDENYYAEIMVFEAIFDFSVNSFEGKKYIINKAYEMRYHGYFNHNNKKNANFLLQVVKKILKSPYINVHEKETIRKLFDFLIIKEDKSENI